jgi:hypothetical protein
VGEHYYPSGIQTSLFWSNVLSTRFFRRQLRSGFNETLTSRSRDVANRNELRDLLIDTSELTFAQNNRNSDCANYESDERGAITMQALLESTTLVSLEQIVSASLLRETRLPAHLLDRAIDYQTTSLAPGTYGAYNTGNLDWQIWCHELRVPPYPISPQIAAAHLADLYPRLKAQTIEKRLAALE